VTLTSVYTQLGDALAARAAAYVDGHITHRVALWPPRLLAAPVLVPPPSLFRPRLCCCALCVAAWFSGSCDQRPSLPSPHPTSPARRDCLRHPAPDAFARYSAPVAPHLQPPTLPALPTSTVTAAHHGVQPAADGCHHHRALQDPHKQRPQEDPQRGGHLADGQQGCTASPRHWPYVSPLPNPGACCRLDTC